MSRTATSAAVTVLKWTPVLQSVCRFGHQHLGMGRERGTKPLPRLLAEAPQSDELGIVTAFGPEHVTITTRFLSSSLVAAAANVVRREAQAAARGNWAARGAQRGLLRSREFFGRTRPWLVSNWDLASKQFLLVTPENGMAEQNDLARLYREFEEAFVDVLTAKGELLLPRRTKLYQARIRLRAHRDLKQREYQAAVLRAEARAWETLGLA
jgi:hypothetical protein